MRQTSYLIELAEEAGFKVTSPKEVKQRGGTITVGHEHAGAVTKNSFVAKSLSTTGRAPAFESRLTFTRPITSWNSRSKK